MMEGGDRHAADDAALIRPSLAVQSKRKLTGIMNFTNPGVVSHNEILQMYKDYIDPEFTWSNFTIEEQAKVIVAPRSNNLLETKRVSGAREGWRCTKRMD